MYYGTDSGGRPVTLSAVSTQILPGTFAGDINSDRHISGLDLLRFALAFGKRPSDTGWDVLADINFDGLVDSQDIDLLRPLFGKKP